jgi:ubiquinone/menaquinone biosynthesis C-methylase UbiE
MDIHPEPNQDPSEDYQDPSDLTLRQNIQDRYGSRPMEWQRWLFDRFRFSPMANILELGSGAGRLWTKNEDRIPSGWQVTLSDYVFPMVTEAQQRLRSLSHPFHFALIDAHHLPFHPGLFDGVVADGLFDLLQDLKQVMEEIFQILKIGGCLYASVGGQNHLKEMKELVKPFTGEVQLGRTSERFTLENGLDVLSSHFKGTRQMVFRDQMVFTEVEPILAYIRSEGVVEQTLTGEHLTKIKRLIETRLVSEGIIQVTIEKGVIEGWKRA